MEGKQGWRDNPEIGTWRDPWPAQGVEGGVMGPGPRRVQEAWWGDGHAGIVEEIVWGTWDFRGGAVTARVSAWLRKKKAKPVQCLNRALYLAESGWERRGELEVPADSWQPQLKGPA